MSKKIHVLIVSLLIYLTTIVIIPDDNQVQANLEGDGQSIGLDYRFIYEITENLSNVIYDAYEDGELRKGRAFGSKGEHAAE